MKYERAGYRSYKTEDEFGIAVNNVFATYGDGFPTHVQVSMISEEHGVD